MRIDLNNENIIRSFKILQGNTRYTVMFQPMWGIPYVLCNFYLSLYMKSRGITDTQIGYLISLGFIFGIGFSLFSGTIVDTLGRKKTAWIFDLICWPVTFLIYIFSGSFWMFALATLTNSAGRVMTLAWNFMIVEGADNRQRIAAYNLINIINISTGILIPLGGIFVDRLGLVASERIFLAFATVSVTIMVFWRNHFYRESEIGLKRMEEYRENGFSLSGTINLFRESFQAVKKRPPLRMAILICILYNTYFSIGTFSSLYFAPYLSERLGVGKAVISMFGGIFSVGTLVVFILVNPVLSKYHATPITLTGLAIQAAGLAVFVMAPPGGYWMVVAYVVLYAVGSSIIKPFIDSLLANATEGDERAAVFTLYNTLSSVFISLVGFGSGYLFKFKPVLLYAGSLGILLLCMVLQVGLARASNPTGRRNKSLPRNEPMFDR